MWSSRPDGTGARRLTAANRPVVAWDHGQPSWSPDGSRIAFSRRLAIVTVSSRGGDERPLGVIGTAPTWSPDGRRIAFGTDTGLAIASDRGRVLETRPHPDGPGDWLGAEAIAWQPRPAR